MSLVLVINSGSSSLKYQLVDVEQGTWIAKGLVERIGEGLSRLVHEVRDADVVEVDMSLPDHAAALELVLDTFDGVGPPLDGLVAVGHRVVHGGPDYREPVIVDDEVEQAIEEIVPLAPLHNPAALLGIRDLRRLMPDVPHVAVFDTAFHATMPPEAYTYAIPADLAAEYRIRRYGFHGTSYRNVTRKAAAFLSTPVDDVNLIVCHLGNGASMAAIRGGRSVDTTMGLTPLQGLMMGTRSGDIDPAVVFHLVRVAGLTLDDVDAMLNKASGLKGLAGDQDMREVRHRAATGDTAARRALDVYAYRIRAYVGAYLAVVPGVQAIVFTAGIGENDAALRREVCGPLRHLGIHLDDDLNRSASSAARAIDDGTGTIRILVIPTNEEAEIARQAQEAVVALRA
ncbi:MAG: acetate kinase [Actinobacteria bacterium]|nr:acetate kinase [Actinomycetota bacterium]